MSVDQERDPRSSDVATKGMYEKLLVTVWGICSVHKELMCIKLSL